MIDSRHTIYTLIGEIILKANNKKLIPIIGFFVVLAVLIGVLIAINAGNRSELYNKSVSTLDPATREQLNDPNYQQIILPDALQQKINNKESFFVYFFASDCPHCRVTTPQLMPLADQEGITLHQFNLKEFEEGWNQYHIEFTPTLVYYENGVEKERIVGGLSETAGDNGNTLDQYKSLFEKYKTNAS
ncbi:thioredoxin family protein [Paenibacillus medicaginis]|uniref:Thioredoxin family protein n=1 Tax=Paenibacillus medicaginis TaxID=1470560 RepID=A0ABV5C2G9_9BACL